MDKAKIIKNSIIGLLIIALGILTAFIIRDVKDNKHVENKNIKPGTIEGKKIKLGISLGTLKEERWIKDRDILLAKAKEMGVEAIIQNANNDDQDQLKQVKYLIEQNIDVLIIAPNDFNKAASAVNLAKRAGIPVISYDRLILNSNVDLYISFDNVKVGELMASAIVNSKKHENLLIVNGARTDNNTSMIKQGYDKILNPLVNSGEINILGEEWTPNWLKEYAFKVVDEALANGTKIDAVIAGNDSLAEGVIEALSEHRLTGGVTVTGQDADLLACQRIVEGTQLMTIYKPIEKLSEVAVQMSIKLANKEPLIINKLIFDGTYDVPYYVLDPIAVDKNNIDDTVIRDGFHLKDEVYRK